MQKWEVGSLVFLAILVAVISTTQTLSAPLVELFDSLFVQILAIFACVGVASVSPTVGIAMAVAFALLFVLRNNSHVQAKIMKVEEEEPAYAATYSPPTSVESDSLQVEMRNKDITKVEERPEGQYPLDEVRPTETATLRPFEYAPQEDTGSNDFSLHGTSIDEKGMIPPSIKPWFAQPTQRVIEL
jgi:MFS superfamily sulfate permease-like transporter